MQSYMKVSLEVLVDRRGRRLGRVARRRGLRRGGRRAREHAARPQRHRVVRLVLCTAAAELAAVELRQDE